MAAVDADFPGAACPPGSRVSFVRDGRSVNGVVAQLQRRGALVVPEAGTFRLRVGYHRLRVVERAGREHTLGEVEALAAELLELHKSHSGLDRAWVFAFDLAPSRAGACRYPERRITLSVSYCLRASMAQIADTVLHEIAHALVGKAHNHDAVWRAKARQIGCNGERTHDLLHTRARWLGECGCGVRWHRQRLHRRLRRGAVCPACRGEIAWRENTRVLEVDAVKSIPIRR